MSAGGESEIATTHLKESGIHFFTSPTCSACQLLKNECPYFFENEDPDIKDTVVVYDNKIPIIRHTVDYRSRPELDGLQTQGYPFRGVPTVFFVKEHPTDENEWIRKKYDMKGDNWAIAKEKLTKDWNNFFSGHTTRNQTSHFFRHMV
jgi:hypothetical protein